MTSPVKLAKQKAQEIWPGAIVHSRGKGWIRHQHPTDSTRLMLDTQIGGIGWHSGNGPFSEADEIDTTWITSSGSWLWEMVHADFHAYINNGSYRYVDATSGEYVNLDVSALEWRNDAGITQNIPLVIVNPVANDDTITWDGLFGSGTQLQIQADTTRLIKRLNLATSSSLPTPTIGGLNLQLVFRFRIQRSNGVNIFINGVEWDDRTLVKTGDIVEFRLVSTGQPMWWFRVPIANDATPTEVKGTQIFKKSGANLFVEVEIPYSFLQTAIYPVMIDPTIDTAIPSGLDDCEWRPVPIYDNNLTYVQLGSNNTSDSGAWRIGLRFTGLTFSGTITASKLSFKAFNDYTGGTDFTIWADDQDNPGQITDNSDGEGRTKTSNYAIWTLPDFTAENWYDTSSLNAVVQELVNSYTISGDAVQFIMKHDLTEHYQFAYSYDSVAGNAPKLHIEYTTGGGQTEESSTLAKFAGLTVTEDITGQAIEESVGLAIYLSVTQPQSNNIYEGVVLSLSNGISSSAQSEVQDAVLLNRIAGASNTSNTNEKDAIVLTVNRTITSVTQANESDVVSLERFNSIIPVTQTNENDIVNLGRLDILIPISQTIENDAVTIEDFIGITVIEETQGFINETVILARSSGIEVLQEGISNVSESVIISRLNEIGEISQYLVNDGAVLNRFNGISENTQCEVNDNVILNRIIEINELSQCMVDNDLLLTKIIQITIIEETQGFANETVILARSAGIEVLAEGISNVSESVIIGRINAIGEISQCLVSDNIILNRLSEISEVEQLQVDININLNRSDGISIFEQPQINDGAVLNRLNGISEVEQLQIDINIVLNRLDEISIFEQPQINDGTVLNRLNGIDEISECLVNDNVILNQVIEINEISQCAVNNDLLLTKIIQITIIDETQGNYSENVILDRFLSLTIFQEGISHVSEGISLARLNAISISEQSNLYNNLIFGRLNGITPFPQTQLYNSLIFSKFVGLSVNSQNIINENITANKFNGLSTDSQIIIPELIALSQLYGLAILDSRYLLESVDLQNSKGLSLIDSPTIFENIELERINIITIMALLLGYNAISLDQFKSIIAERPSLYVYNDGNHSAGVLFRDKRVGVLFRDKRASVRWRDKRGG